MKKNSSNFKAIFSGWLIGSFGTIVVVVTFGLMFGVIIIIFPDLLKNTQFSSFFGFVNLGLMVFSELLFIIVGGYIAGRLAAQAELPYSFVVGILTLCSKLSVFYFVSMVQVGLSIFLNKPTTLPYLIFSIFIISLSLLGGYLAKRKNSKLLGAQLAA